MKSNRFCLYLPKFVWTRQTVDLKTWVTHAWENLHGTLQTQIYEFHIRTTWMEFLRNSRFWILKFGVEKIITVEYNNNFSVCVAYEWLYGGVWSIKKATEWKLCVMISRAKVEEKKKREKCFCLFFQWEKKVGGPHPSPAARGGVQSPATSEALPASP